MEALGRALTLRATGRLSTPGAEDEEQLRELAGLPAVPREQLVVRGEGAVARERTPTDGLDDLNDE